MILKDYQCRECGEITEHFIEGKSMPLWFYCPVCGGHADKILTISQTHPVDADWIGSVLEVVDKQSEAPHCKEFLRHPTRSNYNAWMDGEGLRPLETGERAMPKPDKTRMGEIKAGMLRRFRDRNAVTI